jgi:exosortase/archaeosortase family protein
MVDVIRKTKGAVGILSKRADRRKAKIGSLLLKLLPILSFAAPLAILYFAQNLAYPNYTEYYHIDTFEVMWKGRTFYLFFIWLASLETILGWEEIQGDSGAKLRLTRVLALSVALLLPTMYIVVSNYAGLNHVIETFLMNYVPAEFMRFMPLSIEYLALTLLFAIIVIARAALLRPMGVKTLILQALLSRFYGRLLSVLRRFCHSAKCKRLSSLLHGRLRSECLTIFQSRPAYSGLACTLEYGIKHLKEYAISTVFLGTIGAIFMIDNLYPYGRFTPFQILVPTTTSLAANVLNMLGYTTSISVRDYGPQYGILPTLSATDIHGRSTLFNIAWPCSGIESLLLYSIIILLFLKKSTMPWVHRIAYFAFGAVVTYFINVLRIATIFIISLNSGGTIYSPWTPEVERFHNYYAQLYSITWIMSYPLIIIGSRLLWNKIKNRRNETKNIAKGP